MNIGKIATLVTKGRLGGYEGKIRVSYADTWKGGSYLIASQIERVTKSDALLDAQQLQQEYTPQARV